MTYPRSPDLTLHVFEQDGGWHWALTTERQLGAGKKVVAYSEDLFSSEGQARADGERVAKNWDWEHDDGLRRSELA